MTANRCTAHRAVFGAVGTFIALVVFWPVINNLLTVTAVLGAISNLVLGTVQIANVGVLHQVWCSSQ